MTVRPSHQSPTITTLAVSRQTREKNVIVNLLPMAIPYVTYVYHTLSTHTTSRPPHIFLFFISIFMSRVISVYYRASKEQS